MGLIHGSGEIIAKNEAKRQVFGWSYQTHSPGGDLVIDKSGDYVDDIEELETTAYDYVLRSRTGGADHRKDASGSAIKKSTMIESVVFTPEKIEKMGIPPGVMPHGWWVGFQIEDDETWARVESGELTSFSISGKGTRKAMA